MVAMSARVWNIQGLLPSPDPVGELLVRRLLGHAQGLSNLAPGPALLDGALHGRLFELVSQATQRG